MKKPVLPSVISEQLLHQAEDAMIVSDHDGSIVFANRKASELFGYDEHELVGRKIEDLVPLSHADSHADLRTNYKEAPHTRPLLSGLEIRARRKSGDEVPIDVSLTPVSYEGKMLIASIVRKVDGVSGSEAYFRTLLETAPDAMIIVDEEGLISVVNSQTESKFGYSRSEMLGKPIEMLLPERLRPRHRKHRSDYQAEPMLRPMGQGFELLGRRKNGEEFPVEISLSPVMTANRRFVSSTIRDVTERARMEKQINAARQEAERANKANTAFLAAASHDLRQPVQALALLNGALRRTVKDERALSMIESQEHSLTAMTNLLNSLLDISRLDAGAVAPKIEEFPVRRIIDRLAAEFGRQAKYKGLSFTASSSSAVVRTDASLLGEILQNFVSNAIRYTDNGGVKLRCEESNGMCRLEVLDTGVGIEEKDLELVFQEFNQGSSKTATKEGFGLGLAIVRRLCDLLGLHVSVRSVPGEGSCFSVELPVIASVFVDDEVEDGPGIGSGSSGRVLLVEDNVNVANAWALLLAAEGYSVDQAVSLTEVEELLDKQIPQPALLITDYHLGEGSTGVEVIQCVRKHFAATIPAFIVSGDTSKVLTEARPIENSTLFRKPIDTDELLAAAKESVSTGAVPS